MTANEEVVAPAADSRPRAPGMLGLVEVVSHSPWLEPLFERRGNVPGDEHVNFQRRHVTGRPGTALAAAGSRSAVRIRSGRTSPGIQPSPPVQ